MFDKRRVRAMFRTRFYNSRTIYIVKFIDKMDETMYL